jgi:hypothetical protein
MSMKTIRAIYWATPLVLSSVLWGNAWAVPATLAAPGRSALPVVVSPDASPQTRANAAQLADMLGRISGQRFEVVQGTGESGIVVGIESQFANLKAQPGFKPQHIHGREDYLLRSHPKGLWVLGATDLAVQNGVWDLLHRLGYRHYFPGAAWEIVPSSPTLQIDVNAVERPSYITRRIWYGFGATKESAAAYTEWCRRNRCTAGMQLNTAHAYDGIAKALAKEIDQHPEYLPLIDGQRKKQRHPKLELGNPALRRLVADHALDQFRRKPALDSISMDPSDGGGWSQSKESARLGSVSDQVVTLANEVAETVQTEFPGKLVGIYAYNYHSPPPNIRVHPQVVVSVATAFIQGDLTVEQLMEGWARQGATLGVREYYSVNTWDRDQPAAARGSNLTYLRHTIPRFHQLGARHMSAESSDNWGPNGLGYWLANRMLWNIGEAGHIEQHLEQFLELAFGPAKEPMRVFYEQLDGSRPKLVADDQLGRMYRALSEARQLAAGRPDVLRRLDELTLYTRYCSLYQRYTRASGATRQHAFETLIQHAWRMRQTMMVHSLALYRDLVARDKTVSIPDGAGYRDPPPGNPWKSDTPFSATELVSFTQEGIDSHPLITVDFQPVRYSTVLRPATRYFTMPKDGPPPLDSHVVGRGVQTFLTWVDAPGQVIELSVTGGLAAERESRTPLEIELTKLGGTSIEGDVDTIVATDRTTPADGQEHTVRLTTADSGIYRVRVSDGGDRTRIRWPEQFPMSIISTLDEPMNQDNPQWAAYFYVPIGTRQIGLRGGEHGELIDADGRIHFWLNGRPTNFYTVEVPAGQDGQFWKVRYVRGPLTLLTVPPYFFRAPAEAVLPADVLEQDNRSK